MSGYYANLDPAGGICHYSGSDSSLWNDRFERNHTNTIVAKNAASAWVNGRPDPSDDVIVYRDTAPPRATCLRRVDKGYLPFEGWMNQIVSYKWATNAECAAVGVTDVK